MKRVMSFLLGVAIIFSIPTVTVNAATPSGYAEYGAVGDEMYYDDLELLACIVWAEAGNQDIYGKRLVADVVLNRVDDPRFPDTIKEVIFQKGQFSTVRNGGLDKTYYNVTQDCFTAVSEELQSRSDSEVLFFCANGYSLYGSPMYQYGDHYFSK